MTQFNIGQNEYAVLFVVFICAYVFRQRYIHPLGKFPGPFLASVTNLWRCYDVWTGKSHTNDFERHKRYGPVFRDGSNSLSFSDPNALHAIYGARVSGEFTKSKWYHVFVQSAKEIGEVIFVIRPREEARAVKRRIKHIFTLPNLQKFEAPISDLLGPWIKQLEWHKTVDFGLWSQLFIMDIVETIWYGSPKGFIELGGDVDGYIATIDKGYHALAIVGPSPAVVKLTKWMMSLRNPLAVPQKYKGGFVAMNTSARKMVEDLVSGKRETLTGSPTFAQGLLDSGKNEDPIYAKQYAIKETMSLYLAATHSTSIALTATIYFIARHSQVQRKLFNQICEYERRGIVSKPASYQEVANMPYLTAVIKEAVRLYPSFVCPWPREVPEGDSGGWEILPGIFVPAGTDVGVSAYVSNRDKATFGEDAEEFRPERWLPLDGERSKELDRMTFTFGYMNSSRMCIGKNLALMVIYGAVVEVVRNFEIGLVHPDKRLEDHDTSHIHATIEGLMMVFTPREERI